MIPYGRQSLGQEEIDAVLRALQSDFLTTGPEIDAFERELAEFVGVKHVIAVSSGTAALHLGVAAAGLGPGDRVITSANTFLASANCAAFVGATPDFADIDPATYNLGPETLEKAWQPDTKAIVAVDFAGQPCDYPQITRFARKRGAIVIQDASHSLGGHAFGHPVGGFPDVDAAIFSFHPVKTMTTGEGGAVATNRDDFAEFCREFRTHGMVRDPAKFTMLEPGPWVYEMQRLGFNYRITDLQCALGRAQLRRLDEFVARRQKIVDRYNAAFADLEWIQTPAVGDFLQKTGTRIGWHLYAAQIDLETLGQTRAEVMTRLRERGIGTQVHYIPVHMQPWYRQTYGYGPGKCPNAENLYRRELSLPLYPAMTDEDVETVIGVVRGLVA